MYQASLFNDDVETVINYPSPDQNDPHVNQLRLNESLSMVDTLEFNIYMNNPGYYKISDLITRVKVKDVRDDSIRFTGRVFVQSENMDSDGKTYKKITCEGALGFLNDTNQGSKTFATPNVKIFLEQILESHNIRVSPSKQIMVGNVDVEGSVAHTCEFKSTLSEILLVKDKIGGNVRVREVNDILYLDWLKTINDNSIDVNLGINMKDMMVSKDVSNFGTRIIPLGANNLSIESVNDGECYIEDSKSKAIYGVIEKIVEYRDITDPNILKQTCVSDLQKHTQPLCILECNAIDLSFISGNKAEQFRLDSNLHIINNIMGIDSNYKIIELNLDLLKPYNPRLTISNKQTKLSTTLNDLRRSSIQNNGVYNNVQIGDSFGIRAVRSDDKVITTLNATDGISIENENKKVFYVDSNGTLRAVEGIFDDITSNNMIANEMKTSNTDSYIIFHDQYAEFYKNGRLIAQLGFDPVNAYPSLKLYNDAGEENGISITGGAALGTLGPMDFDSPVNFYNTVNGGTIATQEWVLDNMSGPLQ